MQEEYSNTSFMVTNTHTFPPWGTLAQSMVSTTLVLYTLFLDIQSELEMMLTSTVRSLVLGSSLAALVVPNPVTVATEFTAGLEVGDGRHTGEIGPRG